MNTLTNPAGLEYGLYLEGTMHLFKQVFSQAQSQLMLVLKAVGLANLNVAKMWEDFLHEASE